MSKQLSSSTLGHFKKAIHSPLVVDGENVKLRIQAEREFTQNKVHVDWVRFTCRVRHAPVPDVDVLFPLPVQPSAVPYDDDSRKYPIDEAKEFQVRLEIAKRVQQRARLSIRDLAETDFSVSAQAYELAVQSAAALGPDFSVDAEIKKGMDFYKHRWSILLSGHECGWVGFLSTSESPRQSTQAETIHVNLFGTACTFAASGWNTRIADLVDETDSVLTRTDLALDFFDGYRGGMDRVWADYVAGSCNVFGRKPCFNNVGDWANGHDRSIYIGSREVGKQTNIYEKGDQLYGHQANSEWVRFELRYGNKKRILSSDMLRRPDDFFAGASDWHHSVLLEAEAIPAPAEAPCTPRLQIQSVQAECARNIRWMVSTAASTLAVAIQYLDGSEIMELIGNAKLPGRLRKFSREQIAQCFGGSVKAATTGFPSLTLDPGTVATYSLSPA